MALCALQIFAALLYIYNMVGGRAGGWASAKHSGRACSVRTFFLPGAPFRPDGGGGWRKKLPAARASEGAASWQRLRRPGHFWYCITFAKIASRIERRAKSGAKAAKDFWAGTNWMASLHNSLLINLPSLSTGKSPFLYAYAAFMLRAHFASKRNALLTCYGWCKLLCAQEQDFLPNLYKKQSSLELDK